MTSVYCVLLSVLCPSLELLSFFSSDNSNSLKCNGAAFKYID